MRILSSSSNSTARATRGLAVARAKLGRQVCLAGEAGCIGNFSQWQPSVANQRERVPKPQLTMESLDGHAGGAPKQPAQMKLRIAGGARELGERESPVDVSRQEMDHMLGEVAFAS